ncbi:MoaD/ThiS family protein [Halarsenatibacter silvermanii]|uniref:Mut7-C ubiquitin n=1 Tax=Halarsenatibacter silvermanii TaxID=321763 RepID=A0A1G9PVU3_9FIRM|nr:MoaD/ThiS family protein [Halarsenatibacter silvermanii]SDM02874.1 Mut7-C ubiquitin [Halarsenatibacter silvermanii]
MARIEVKLLGNLKYYPEEKNKMQIIESEESDEIILNEVIEELNIPEDEINLILVNGREKSPNSKVEEGDSIKILPVVSGGI